MPQMNRAGIPVIIEPALGRQERALTFKSKEGWHNVNRNRIRFILERWQLSIVGFALVGMAWQVGGDNVWGQDKALEPPKVETLAAATVDPPATTSQAPTASELAKLRNRETRARRGGDSSV